MDLFDVNRKLLSDSTGRYTTTFDELSRLKSVVNPASKRLTNLYDAIGRRSTLLDPDGGRFTYGYDSANRMTRVVNPESHRTTLGYDAADRKITKRLANGTRASMVHDATGQTLNVVNLKSTGVTISVFAYQYDPAGNRTQVVEATGDIVTWTYDASNQLQRERRSGPNSYDLTHVYDPVGNRTLKVKDGDRTTSTYDVANRLRYSVEVTGRTTFTFDAAGNQIQEEKPNGDVTTSLWDCVNKNTAVVLPNSDRVTSVYSGDGLRVAKSTDTDDRLFVYDGQNILLETDGFNLTQAVFTLQPSDYGNLLSQHRLDGALWEDYYHHFDVLGSTDSLTDGSEVVTDSYTFEAFGKLQTSSGSTNNPFTWVGELGYFRDVETGDYDLRARKYQPDQARFKSEDDYQADPLNNLYRYAENQPNLWVDPSGNDPPMDADKILSDTNAAALLASLARVDARLQDERAGDAALLSRRQDIADQIGRAAAQRSLTGPQFADIQRQIDELEANLAKVLVGPPVVKPDTVDKPDDTPVLHDLLYRDTDPAPVITDGLHRDSDPERKIVNLGDESPKACVKADGGCDRVGTILGRLEKVDWVSYEYLNYLNAHSEKPKDGGPWINYKIENFSWWAILAERSLQHDKNVGHRITFEDSLTDYQILLSIRAMLKSGKGGDGIEGYEEFRKRRLKEVYGYDPDTATYVTAPGPGSYWDRYREATAAERAKVQQWMRDAGATEWEILEPDVAYWFNQFLGPNGYTWKMLEMAPSAVAARRGLKTGSLLKPDAAAPGQRRSTGLRPGEGPKPVETREAPKYDKPRINLEPSRVGRSEVTNSFTNLGEGISVKNAETLKNFGPDSAFSGVYNPHTKQFLAYPSGDTKLTSGAVPENLVGRRGGHAAVNAPFSQLTGVDPKSNVGFTMFVEKDGSLSVDWLSRSVNGPNPAFPGSVVPEAMRSDVMRTIESATGRTVRSK